MWPSLETEEASVSVIEAKPHRHQATRLHFFCRNHSHYLKKSGSSLKSLPIEMLEAEIAKQNHLCYWTAILWVSSSLFTPMHVLWMVKLFFYSKKLLLISSLLLAGRTKRKYSIPGSIDRTVKWQGRNGFEMPFLFWAEDRGDEVISPLSRFHHFPSKYLKLN